MYQNKNDKTSIEGRIGYIGPLQRRNSFPRIKFDLTADELLALKPALRQVHHPYSDNPENGIKVNCYSFSEIFAEKIRALSQRASPRDLYDVIHLYRHVQATTNPKQVLKVLKEKCAFKKIIIPNMKSIEQHEKIQELKASWQSMLGHQLPMLPPFENFWQELPKVFEWLYGVGAQNILRNPIVHNQLIDQSWRPPKMIQAWHTNAPIELIRYAGANHLCVELTYENKKRLVEPYEIKRTQEENLILIAMKHDSKEWRTYRLDRIQGIEVATISFVPNYQISLTETGF